MKVYKLIEKLQSIDENKDIIIIDTSYKSCEIENITEDSRNIIIDIKEL